MIIVTRHRVIASIALTAAMAGVKAIRPHKPVNIARPVIVGKAQVGQTLHVSRGRWLYMTKPHRHHKRHHKRRKRLWN